MTDNLPNFLPFAPNEGVSSPVAGIKAVFGWLGGSLASITAIFHATGYLVTRAHLSMLGLHGVIDFDNHDIVREGGKFFSSLGTRRCGARRCRSLSHWDGLRLG